MRVAEKGQVTIPKAIPDCLGIVPGSKVKFIPRGTEVLFEKQASDDASVDPAVPLLRNIVRHRGSCDLGGLQADEIFHLLRG